MEGPATPAWEQRFAVRRRLGEGGFGVVYEAWDLKLGRPIAVKYLRRQENAALLRFKREFRALADVIHPNLVRLGELVSMDETWFFTMELVDGTDILTYVEQPGAGRDQREIPDSPTVNPESLTIDTPPSGPPAESPEGGPVEAGVETRELAPRPVTFDEDRLRESFGQLAEGINALHGYGMLHRDLKPSNVLVNRDGRVVVLDFGLVAHFGRDDLTRSVQIVGTPAYMSPEQAMGREVGPASDWYSVGVMLYEALTGSHLFRGSYAQILIDRQSSAVPRVSDLVPGAPADLDELCHELLQLDPAARPDGAEIARRLDRKLQVAVAAPPPGAPARFVGRRRQLAMLDEALNRVRTGRAATVFVSGASGMGKTALARSFLDRVRSRDPRALVLEGRCYQRENVPYKALDSLVDELSRHLGRMTPLEAARFMPRDRSALARLFPVLAGLGEAGSGRRSEPEVPDAMELRRRAFAALRELLGRLADGSTVALFIDDLQWGDVDSAALMREITRPPDPPPVLLLVCFRKEEAGRSPLLRALVADGEHHQDGRWTVELAELPPDEAEELALAVIGEEGADARARAAQIARESGGSPFFVDELARHQASAGDAGVEALRLDSVLEARAAGLPAEARSLLEVIAVAGEPVDLEVAARAAELAVGDTTAIDPLRAGHWVRSCALEGRDAFETFHDRIRETAVSLIPEARRPDCHLRLAEAWEEAGTASSATLVEHFMAAGAGVRAAGHARRAADQAAAELAFDRAARLYQICLDVGAWEAPERGELLARLATALANAGRGGVAARAYLAAAEAATSQDALDLRRRAAEQFLVSGHIDEGREALEAVLSRVGMRLPATPHGSLVGLLLRRLQIASRGLRFIPRHERDADPALLAKIDVCWSVAIGFGMVENIRGAHFQAINLLLALQVGETFRVARALALELPFSAAGGSHTARRTAALMERCREMVEGQDDAYLNGLFALQVGAVASLEGRFEASLEACTRAETILREQCTGVTWELDTAQLYHNHVLTMMGHWRDLGERVPVMLEDARDRADLYIATYLKARNEHILFLAADEAERAREQQARSLDGWSQAGFQVQHYWDWYARSEIDLYSGAPEAAWERLESGWPALKRSLLTRAQVIFFEAVLLRARVALALAAQSGGSQAERYLSRAGRDARLLEREAMPASAGSAALIRAGVAAGRGDAAAARGLLMAAVGGLGRAAVSHYLAAARWRLGELLGGDDGASEIEGARAWFEEQGVRNPERMVAMLAPGRWS